MRTQILIIFLLAILFGCSHNSQKEKSIQNQIDSSICSTKDVNVSIASRSIDSENIQANRNRTFSDKTFIFSKADTNSIKIDTILFNTLLYPYNKIENLESQGEIWYKIKMNNKEGYIKEKDLAEQNFEFNNNKYGFLVGMGRQNKSITLRRYGFNGHKILEEYETAFLSSTYSIEQIPWSTLKSASTGYDDNSHILFRYMTAMNSCPGTTHWEYIIDSGTDLNKIASGFSEGEADYDNSSIVYIPIRFGNGKVMLVANGDIQNIFNFETASLNTFPYSDKIGIPINDLIVIKNEENVYFMDENENFIKNKDGSFKTKSSKKDIQYYGWNGQDLTKK